MNHPPREQAIEELAALDARVRALLPARYQHCYTNVSPTSMGSAGIRYGPDGKVVWGEIWTTFCDLALAGGPPHRGKLLEPVAEADATADPGRTAEVVAEIARAVDLTTGLTVAEGDAPGWIGVACASPEEAAWLQFAVTAENVSARRRGSVLQLPAGPSFRVEKEIKNVVVALAKSCHYWDGHLSDSQQSLAGADVWEPASASEIAADPDGYRRAVAEIEGQIQPTGLAVIPDQYPGWVGVETGDDETVVWMLRAVLVGPILARREEVTVYLPVAANAPLGQAASVGRAFAHAWDLRQAASAAAPRPSWRDIGRDRG